MSDMETFKTLFLLCLCMGISYADRNVTTTFLQSVNKDNSTVSIGYVEAKGTTDTLHYMFSTEGVPSVLFVRTQPKTAVKIESEKITFDPPSNVLYHYGVAFSRLIAYNDSDDHADMQKYDSNNNKTFHSFRFEDFQWENMTAQSDPKGNTVLMNVSHSYLNDVLDTNGSITIKFAASGGSGREDQLPHLQYNENLTQFDLNIDHIMTDLSKARFAVELIMLGNGKEDMKLDETKSIDDEYTPGVFRINNWLSNSASSSDKGFLQWKPVCYTSMARARRVATSVKHYGMKKLTAEQNSQLDMSILHWYYGDAFLGVTRNAMNLSFGMSEDGTYNKTKVMSWSGSIGYGTPPEDSVSTIVIIIISAGLGLPVVIILLGGVYVCVKKRQNKDPKPLRQIQNGYQSIPDNDN